MSNLNEIKENLLKVALLSRTKQLQAAENHQDGIEVISQISHADQTSNLLTNSLVEVQMGDYVNNKRDRCEKKPIPEEQKDDRYYERRKKNNLAAKKSRDMRKRREEGVAERADQLEKENSLLRAQVSTLREELNSLQALLLGKRITMQRLREERNLKEKLILLKSLQENCKK